ncbi:unnamed protein product [Brassica napus]|uniref:(rape) hypothetical protein n=1 Tax=Brassica napus TaxID=3708 RepID=A0A816KEP9_BRANA|nr:unnamed protein product [Brassica napus]
MANVLVLLSDLHSGRSSSAVEVRLLRFWEARNVRRSGELMGVDMLLPTRSCVLFHFQSTMMRLQLMLTVYATHLTNLEEGWSTLLQVLKSHIVTRIIACQTLLY